MDMVWEFFDALEMFFRFKMRWHCVRWLQRNPDMLLAYEYAFRFLDEREMNRLHAKMPWPIGWNI
jgi:hypothetical protein